MAKTTAIPGGEALTRDQRRAKHAYACVAEVVTDDAKFKEYRTAVNGLGANVLRSGLSAALAFLERQKERSAVKSLLDHLARAGIPGLQGVGPELPRRARELPVQDYMLATRELLAVVQWFKRACQAQGKA